MNIIGKWNIRELQTVDDSFTIRWQDINDFLADEAIGEDAKEAVKCSFIFREDGTYVMVMPIPEGTSKEMIESAVAAGEIELIDDSHAAVNPRKWKEENGKLMYESGTDESDTTWNELIVFDDGSIELMPFRLAKAD